MRTVPTFAGLVRTGLARARRLARLGAPSGAPWSGVLSRHPLTASARGLARWSPSALSAYLTGWATRQPWSGGWAPMVYGPRQVRRRRGQPSLPPGEGTEPGVTARLSGEALGDEGDLAATGGRADDRGPAAQDAPLTRDERSLNGPPLERLVAAGLRRADEMTAVGRTDVRVGQVAPLASLAGGGLRQEAPSEGRETGPVTHAPSERVVRRPTVETELSGGEGWSGVLAASRPVRPGSAPLAPASVDRLWQPADVLTLPTPPPSIVSEPLSGAALARSERRAAQGEVGTDDNDESTESRRTDWTASPRGAEAAAPATPSATIARSGPPEPGRLWQPPTRRLSSTAFPSQARVEPGGLTLSIQRQRTAERQVFVAPPLHPVRLWHAPVQAGGPAEEVASLAGGGVVYRQSQARREPATRRPGSAVASPQAPPTAPGYAVHPGRSADREAASGEGASLSRLEEPITPPGVSAPGLLLSPAEAGSVEAPGEGGRQVAPARRAASGEWAGVPEASPPGLSTGEAVQRDQVALWPLGELMTTTTNLMLTGIGTARRLARGGVGGIQAATRTFLASRTGAASSDLEREPVEGAPSLLGPRGPASLQRAARPASETGPQSYVGGSPSPPASVPSPAPAPTWASAPPHPDWPVLGHLANLSKPAPAPEPAAFQVLRRLAPARAADALAALASLPTLGTGEALHEQVRRPMEALTRRDLSAVRLYTSPVAEALGAEAFTTGERVVFAPGRLNLRTPQGMALLGHELSHVGQALAFKLTAGAHPPTDDAEEQAAGQQEDVIRRVVEQGWPEGSRREVRQAARALSAMMEHGGIAQPPAPGGPAAPGGPGAPAAGGGSANGGGGNGDAPVAMARLSEAPPTPASGAASAPAAQPDVEALARQVYTILKARLRAERDRHQLYGH